ncbi:hypothetical protein Tco_0812162 [Tanacetum coccineum]
MESSTRYSKERELQLTQRLAKQRHSHCLTWVEQLETHLYDLYLLNSPYAVDAFKPAFRSFFGEEHQTFKLKMFHNLDQLRLQLERENLHGVNAKTCLQALRNSSREFLAAKGVQCNGFLTGWQNKTSNTSLSCKPRALQTQEEKVNMREAVDAGLVVTESSGTNPDKQNTSSSLGSYTTQAVDADIRPVIDKEPFVRLNSRAKSSVHPKNHKQQTVEPKNHTHREPAVREWWKPRVEFFEAMFRLKVDTYWKGVSSIRQTKIRWQKRIFLHLNLQDEMNRSFIAQNSYRLERETFSKIYRSCRRILSSTFQLIFRSLLHDNIVPKPDLALELGKSISLTEAEEEAVAREVHATHARIVSGPDPEPMQEDQTGSNSGKLHVSLAGPNPEHMDDEFLATAYPKVHENLKLIIDERVIEENPESHSGSMSSMKNLDDTYNFGDQFLYDKPTEDDQEKSKVIEESDSTIPDPSHQTVTSTPPVIAPFTDVSSTKPSSLLRVARLEQEMSEVKKTDHSADVLALIKSQVPTFNRERNTLCAWPESIKNQESEKSPKEIIRIKREQGEEKHDSTYSIRSTDKSMMKKSDDDEDPFSWIKPGVVEQSERRPEYAASWVRSALEDWQITDKERDDVVNSLMAYASKQHPALTQSGWADL